MADGVKAMASNEQMLSQAIAIFTRRNWKAQSQVGDTIQFSRSKKPNGLTSLLLIIFLPVIGLVIVLVAYVTAKDEFVSVTVKGGGFSVQAKNGSRWFGRPHELEGVAKSGKVALG